MSDEMSAEAKERAFKKARTYTPQQTQWLERFANLGLRLQNERVTVESYRAILIHLGLDRDTLMRRCADVGKRPQTAANLVPYFQHLLRTTSVFRGDDILKTKLREFAVAQGLTKEQILAATSR